MLLRQSKVNWCLPFKTSAHFTKRVRVVPSTNQLTNPDGRYTSEDLNG